MQWLNVNKPHLCPQIYSNLVMSAVSAGVFSVILFAMGCVGLANSNLHRCRLTVNNQTTSCTTMVSRPLLLITLLF